MRDRLFTSTGPLPEQIEALWRRQADEWPRLAKGLAALRAARVRSLSRNGAQLRVQCNPARIVSTGAKMDAASIAARPCFLCPANLPPEQLAVPWGDDWLILCNPAPIFDPHFVISRNCHEPQRIGAALGVVLDLSRDLAGAYTVFYNGPRSGASAPDHIHIQAVRADVLPFEVELIDGLSAGAGWIETLRDRPARLAVTREGRRPAVALTGGDRAALIAAVEDVVRVLGDVHPTEPEPMLNLFARHTGQGWLVYLFPRYAHRPACYGTGPGQFVISPGSVDLGGVMIAPRPEDFERLTAEQAVALLDEVLLPPDLFARVRKRLAAQ